ncbi:MAG: LysM peptidoglycan-binding domain-containing protein [Chitinophagaceae bacterium]|nr:LysM peptidoglycan-binding domain-containing protein [Chitinophagaceae bacterium]
MKKFIFIVSLFTLGMVQNVLAQNTFVVHTVKEGETLSELAKQYKTTVGDIMRLNGMNTKSLLYIGEKVKIPTDSKPVKVNVASVAHTPVAANSDTAAQKKSLRTLPPAGTTSNATAQTKLPRTLPAAGTTHVVQKGETLSSIGKAYHVYVAEIKKWNNLTSDVIKIGQVLRLSPQSADKQKPSNPPVVQNTKTIPVPDNSKKQNKDNSSLPPAKSTPVNTQSGSAGYFAPLYGKGSVRKKETTREGRAMTFNTASGVNDKKYYILMNDAIPGTIVKISFGNKSIYAKVLWNLGYIKDNEGLDYRICNAAATALGIDTEAFNISVSRYQ